MRWLLLSLLPLGGLAGKSLSPRSQNARCAKTQNSTYTGSTSTYTSSKGTYASSKIAYASSKIAYASSKIAYASSKSTYTSSKSTYTSTSSKSTSTGSTSTGSTYTLKDFYQGQSFLSDDWDYYSGPDYTHGSVIYQTKEDAIKKNLAYVQPDGTTVLAVDDFSKVPVGGWRDSIRIKSRKTYDGGLFIADFQAMPYGCSVWPAYWSVGDWWPDQGEMDIIEGVHNQLTNQYTLHSGPGCSLAEPVHNSVLSKLLSTTCTSSKHTNGGCAFRDNDPRSYGKNFNNVNGGVFAHLWTDTGVLIYRFFRGNIPSDITDKKPDPSGWGPPAASFIFSPSSCNTRTHFFGHSLVLDICLCGDWGNPAYATSGCPGTCAEAVANSANLHTAKWEINYIAVYE